jgi:hypothetical protein
MLDHNQGLILAIRLIGNSFKEILASRLHIDDTHLFLPE